MDAKIGVADHAARGWLESSTGFSFSPVVVGGQPAIRLALNESKARLAEECSVLGDNEYIACTGDKETDLYLRDGVVSFKAYESEITVTPIGDVNSPFPQMALEAALSRAFLLQNSLAVHALVLDYQGFGILALGHSAVGKTALALAGLACGAKIVSDDRVLITQGDDGLVAKSLRPFLQIRPDTVRRFPVQHLPPVLRGMRASAEGVVRLSRQQLPEAFVSSVPVKAIVLLSAESRGKTLRVARADHAQVISAMIGGSSPFLFSQVADPHSRRVLLFVASALQGLTSMKMVVGSSLLEEPVKEFGRLMASLAVER